MAIPSSWPPSLVAPGSVPPHASPGQPVCAGCCLLMHRGAQAVRDSGGREEEHLLWGLHGPDVLPVIISDGGGAVLHGHGL